VSETRHPPEWGADFFGGLNDLPPEPVAGIGQILEAMATLPAYRDARRWALGNLNAADGGSILEGGCGTGAALPDVLAVVGNAGRIAGFDPTSAFIDAACDRAGNSAATNARYQIGDIRALPVADGEFDGAFCDKVLIHAGPASAALDELVRVVRPGGRVAAIEWLPFFLLSSRLPDAVAAFNEIFKKSVFEYGVAGNLARHFSDAGLRDIRTAAFLATTNSLDDHPFWRAFIVGQMPMFVHAELIEERVADELVADLEELNAKGVFSASFIVQAAVGEKLH
jgi:ubiquinone/menaquinone biosynthesis C-methylase UbiE